MTASRSYDLLVRYTGGGAEVAARCLHQPRHIDSLQELPLKRTLRAGEVIASIVAHLRRMRPHVVITFGPDGSTGHPDHIAISQFTTAALVCAADPEYSPQCDWPPHRVAKLYYLAGSRARIATYQAVFGDPAMTVGGVKRSVPGWANWAITTRINTVDYWSQVWQAIACHRSQLPNYEALVQLPEERHRELWGTQEFYRALSLVNGGRTVEHDLFAGLR